MVWFVVVDDVRSTERSLGEVRGEGGAERALGGNRHEVGG